MLQVYEIMKSMKSQSQSPGPQQKTITIKLTFLKGKFQIKYLLLLLVIKEYLERNNKLLKITQLLLPLIE